MTLLHMGQAHLLAFVCAATCVSGAAMCAAETDACVDDISLLQTGVDFAKYHRGVDDGQGKDEKRDVHDSKDDDEINFVDEKESHGKHHNKRHRHRPAQALQGTADSTSTQGSAAGAEGAVVDAVKRGRGIVNALPRGIFNAMNRATQFVRSQFKSAEANVENRVDNGVEVAEQDVEAAAHAVEDRLSRLSTRKSARARKFDRKVDRVVIRANHSFQQGERWLADHLKFVTTGPRTPLPPSQPVTVFTRPYPNGIVVEAGQAGEADQHLANAQVQRMDSEDMHRMLREKRNNEVADIQDDMSEGAREINRKVEMATRSVERQEGQRLSEFGAQKQFQIGHLEARLEAQRTAIRREHDQAYAAIKERHDTDMGLSKSHWTTVRASIQVRYSEAREKLRFDKAVMEKKVGQAEEAAMSDLQMNEARKTAEFRSKAVLGQLALKKEVLNAEADAHIAQDLKREQQETMEAERKAFPSFFDNYLTATEHAAMPVPAMPSHPAVIPDIVPLRGTPPGLPYGISARDVAVPASDAVSTEQPQVIVMAPTSKSTLATDSPQTELASATSAVAEAVRDAALSDS
eukprot:gnl/TRDRNA2_/TRDRNA2_35631_c0_seq1.p1 gnl/TRDRNA2_/TRDRNA2_35631_c0~~gnl/TRDRNA2_/TRDRNA2_35631_c0_seq1.p1  ORF type:complete len:576 (+),score=92.28 gnl/TRDRNA2_/TRDRNA2_35631_c0_seq1:1-1728(+)